MKLGEVVTDADGYEWIVTSIGPIIGFVDEPLPAGHVRLTRIPKGETAQGVNRTWLSSEQPKKVIAINESNRPAH